MSITQAKGIARSLRWHHLGFCFFWAITFTALSDPPVQYAAGYEAYSLCRQIVVLATLCAAVVFSRSHREFAPKSAIAAGVVLSAGSLLYYLSFFYGSYSLASAVISGALVGGATGLFYVAWQSFYASEGSSRTTVYIPLSAAVSVVLCILLSVLPFEWTVLCAVIVLPACATYTLYASLREIEPYEIEPMTPARSRMLARDMWKPVFCVCAIGFVWQLIGHLEGGSSQTSFVAIMAGMSVATLAVSAIELFSEHGFDVLRVYQVLFPVVTGVFLLPTFFGATWLPVASAFTMFGFEVVNLLLLIACAVYASRFAMHSSLVYATCVGPTLFSLMMGDVVGAWLDRSVLYDLTVVVDILFVCIYVLAVAMFVISVGRGKKKGGESSDGAKQAATSAEGEEEGACAPHNADVHASEGRLRHGVEHTNETSSGKGRKSHASATLASDNHALEDMSAENVSGVYVPSHANVQKAAPSASADPLRPTFEDRLAALDLPEPLSPRETEVAALVVRGNTVAAIARKLFISENTVRGHTKAIYRKLAIHSKQELIDLLG